MIIIPDKANLGLFSNHSFIKPNPFGLVHFFYLCLHGKSVYFLQRKY